MSPGGAMSPADAVSIGARSRAAWSSGSERPCRTPDGPRGGARRDAGLRGLFPLRQAKSVGVAARAAAALVRARALARGRALGRGLHLGPARAAGDPAQGEHELLGTVARGQRVVELDLAVLHETT